MSILPSDLSPLRRRLLAWFDRHARDLPWRHTRDPYAIWVSEVMLQQTQVAAIVPYFLRFMEAFPTVARLAQASAQDVLRLWEGLGYYRRARSLHQAASLMQEQHEGRFPRTAAALHALPGFGRYTVHAVLSQAFDERLPILETNSERVLCRLLAIQENPQRGDVRKILWDAAARLLPQRRVGAFNQALMEVGAIVCKPSKPACPACPLKRWCLAKAKGLEELIPRRREKEPETVREVALVLERGRRVLWTQRPEHGRWPTMWEFPHLQLEAGETPETAAQRLLGRLGVGALLGEELGTICHAVTRFRITLVCLQARYQRGRFLPSEHYVQGLWLAPALLHAYPVSAPQRKLARLAAQTREGCPLDD